MMGWYRKHTTKSLGTKTFILQIPYYILKKKLIGMVTLKT